MARKNTDTNFSILELNKTISSKNENLDTIIVDSTEIPIGKPKNKKLAILAKVDECYQNANDY